MFNKKNKILPFICISVITLIGGDYAAEKFGGLYSAKVLNPAELTQMADITDITTLTGYHAASEIETAAIDNEFAAFPYYIEERLERYEAFRQKNRQLELSAVVWQVNADLDHDYYENANMITGANPLLVNKHNKLPDDFIPEGLIDAGNGHLVTPGTLEAFNRMKSAAKSHGCYIDIASAYRSFERQKFLFYKEADEHGQESAEANIAKPGFSEHQTGRAIDIIGSIGGLDQFEGTPEYEWLNAHCHEYGFIIRYYDETSKITGFASEPWHITFVGKSISLDMKNKDTKSLDEYIAKNPYVINDEPIDDRKIVIVDAGHGGTDPGCERDGIYEKDINLDIAVRLKASLEQNGVNVIMTRSDDSYILNTDRVALVNRGKAEAFISIHQNAYEDEDVHGIETWYDGSDTQKDSFRLAGIIHKKVLAATNSADRGINDDNSFIVLGKTNIPAVIVETGFISNNYELKLLLDSQYIQKIAESIAEGVVGFLNPKTMYLTFDDGPSPKNTPVVLDILKQRNIKATFFVIGQNAEDNPDLIKRIVDEGHSLGIHCYNHEYKTIYKSLDSYISDFNRASDIVFEITGIRPTIYRFPGGSINNFNRDVYEEIIEEMNKRGYVYYDWNASIEDAWGNTTPDDLIRNAKNEVQGQKRVILLAHDAYPCTTEALNGILDLFPEYKMEKIISGTKPVQFRTE